MYYVLIPLFLILQLSIVSPELTKHTLKLWIVWRQNEISSNDDEKLANLFILIAQQKVGNRPRRIEPRAVKRRPKPFPLLMQPRQIAREDIRKYGHPNNLK